MEHKDRQMHAEQITTEYMKKIYSFALKRTANLQDAEDLTQDVCLKLYKVLQIKEDIENVEKFIWTVAHNALANYYRDKTKSCIGNIDDFSEVFASDDPLPEDNIIEFEKISKLQNEIAYLSKLQRKVILLYYYSRKKQSEIAEILNIPIGTVKWHLSEAKGELKKGMDTMRNCEELKFNPIKFDIIGTNGSVGTMGMITNFLRSTLTQNILYCVWKEAKTINEIANCLGVSPVYIESEVEFLDDNGFLIKQSNKYLANILIDESTSEHNKLQSNIYDTAAKLIVNDLFDELVKSNLIEDKGLYFPDRDKNFLMWSLVFYVCAISGEKIKDTRISFEEAATIRPDGGVNIACASIINEGVIPPKYYDSMKKFCGPCWNSSENTVLWQIDSEWSTCRITDTYEKYISRDINLLERFSNGDILSDEDYSYMAEKGYIKKDGAEFKLAIVRVGNKELKHKLIEIGDKIREKYIIELGLLRDEFTKSIMDATPKHLRKMQGFGLQQIFYSDGWFILHCAKELVNNGKLKILTDDLNKSISMIMISNK